MSGPGAGADETPVFLTSGEFLAFTGLTPRQMTYWVESEFLFPRHEGGSGNGREWPMPEALIAKRMGVLVGAGLPLAWSADFARSGTFARDLARGVRITITRGDW